MSHGRAQLVVTCQSCRKGSCPVFHIVNQEDKHLKVACLECGTAYPKATLAERQLVANHPKRIYPWAPKLAGQPVGGSSPQGGKAAGKGGKGGKGKGSKGLGKAVPGNQAQHIKNLEDKLKQLEQKQVQPEGGEDEQANDEDPLKAASRELRTWTDRHDRAKKEGHMAWIQFSAQEKQAAQQKVDTLSKQRDAARPLSERARLAEREQQQAKEATTKKRKALEEAKPALKEAPGKGRAPQ